MICNKLKLNWSVCRQVFVCIWMEHICENAEEKEKKKKLYYTVHNATYKLKTVIRSDKTKKKKITNHRHRHCCHRCRCRLTSMHTSQLLMNFYCCCYFLFEIFARFFFLRLLASNKIWKMGGKCGTYRQMERTNKMLDIKLKWKSFEMCCAQYKEFNHIRTHTRIHSTEIPYILCAHQSTPIWFFILFSPQCSPYISLLNK